MNLGLKDQIVLIAGSSRGIGKAIAQGFLEEGAKVAITGRDEIFLLKTKEDFLQKYSFDRILAIRGDLTKDKEIEQCKNIIMTAWGRIDHLILNTGTGRSSPEILSNPQQWSFIFDQNLNSSYKMIFNFLPQMQLQKKGSIIFIASIAGQEALGAPIDYSTAKAALIAFSKNLSRKVAHDGIRVNTISPGNIFFPEGTWDQQLKTNKEKVSQMLEKNVPLQRFGTPQEVTSAVLFLSSQEASFITGTLLTVDGGQTCAT